MRIILKDKGLEFWSAVYGEGQGRKGLSFRDEACEGCRTQTFSFLLIWPEGRDESPLQKKHKKY